MNIGKESVLFLTHWCIDVFRGEEMSNGLFVLFTNYGGQGMAGLHLLLEPPVYIQSLVSGRATSDGNHPEQQYILFVTCIIVHHPPKGLNLTTKELLLLWQGLDAKSTDLGVPRVAGMLWRRASS